MTIWRPSSGIRVKALGLNWRGNQLLAAEVLDDSGRVKGVRPIGGTVEFGETAEAAVIREFGEELGITVQTPGSPFFMENIYTHEGSLGHEILAIFEVTFPQGAFVGTPRIEFREENDVKCFAEWFDLDELDLPHRPQLYPQGLKARLQRARG
ncbi:MAG: NUDIX domain-containing protein [Pseudomonadota bacterium]